MASNSLIAVNQDQNIFDSKKRNKAATATVESLETKLNHSQRSAIARNNALLVTDQMDLCKQLLSTLDLIIAGALTKAGKHQEAVSALDTSDPVRRRKNLVLGSLNGYSAVYSIEEDYSCDVMQLTSCSSPAVKQVCLHFPIINHINSNISAFWNSPIIRNHKTFLPDRDAAFQGT